MNYLKTVFVLMLLVTLLPFALAENPVLQATLMKYEPVPAEPGKYVTAYVKVENSGNRDAQNVVVELLPEYPFTVDDREESKKSLGILGSNKDYVFEYKLRVAADAVTGDNELKVRFNSDDTAWQETSFMISVQSGDATLGVTSASLVPAVIAPGEKGVLTLRLKNMADDVLQDITVSLDLFSTTTATATSVSIADPPFAPIGGTNEKKIFKLLSGQSEELSFPLQTYTTATPGVYKLPITITYADSVGTQYDLTQLIGVVVGSEPELTIVVDSTTLRNVPSEGDITIKVVNKGLSDVKFLNVVLKEGAAFEIMSPSNEAYLGNLDSDDYDTATFTLQLKGVQERLELPVEITYRDANNNPYTQKATVSVKLFANGETKSPVVLIIVVLLVVVIISYIVYMRVRKPKKK